MIPEVMDSSAKRIILPTMDEFVYNYNDGTGETRPNQLTLLDDNGVDLTGFDDLKNGNHFYVYNAIGQLTYLNNNDNDEDDQYLEYDVYGKVTAIYSSYTDPAGQYFSPYLGMGNSPVMGSDPNGETVIFVQDGFRGGNLVVGAFDIGIAIDHNWNTMVYVTPALGITSGNGGAVTTQWGIVFYGNVESMKGSSFNVGICAIFGIGGYMEGNVLFGKDNVGNIILKNGGLTFRFWEVQLVFLLVYMQIIPIRSVYLKVIFLMPCIICIINIQNYLIK